MSIVGRSRDIYAFHRKLFLAVLVGLAVPFLAPADWGPVARGISGWDVGATLYIVGVWIMMLRSGEDDLRRRASAEDQSRGMVLALCAVAALVSLGAVPALLGDTDKLADGAKTLHTTLGIYTIVCSWVFLQTIFTVHYAHEYYSDLPADQAPASEDGSRKKKAKQARGGLDFAGEEPFYHYTDFAYFCFTIGMTFQTSDTGVTTARMRRLALIHSIIAFFFNTVILALTINVVAGLLGGK
jgi:uncharacterized membrane protein